MFYVYDKAHARARGSVSGAPRACGRPRLGGMTPITFPAADGTMIPGYLTLPAGLRPARTCPRSSCRTAARARATNGASTGSRSSSPRAASRCSSPTSAARRAMATHGSRRTASSRGRPRSATSTMPGRWLLSAGHRRAGQAGDRRLVLWRLCRAAIRRARSRSVQGDRRGRAGDRSRHAARANARDFTNFRWSIASSAAGRTSAKGRRRRTPAQIKAPVLLFHGDHRP